MEYLKSLLRRRPIPYTGHNPAGSWAIYAIVVLGLIAGVSGYATYNDMGGHWIESLHEGASNVMLAVVIGHVAGVIISSLLHRENLVRSMVTGYKAGEPRQAIDNMRWVAAVVLACGVAVLWSRRGLRPGAVRGSAVDGAADASR